MTWWEYVMLIGAALGIVVGVCLLPLIVLIGISECGKAWRGKP